MMKEVMARKDRIVHLSVRESGRAKPVLLLLHGATDDPTEMMDIVREWRTAYDVSMYCYNYHRPVESVGADLVKEITRVRAENGLVTNATVVVFSYSAIVFREAVISADDWSLFSGMSLIQLVPTAGGSRLASWLRIPIIGYLAGLASKPSAAENPYGRLTKKLWDDEGNNRFCEAIRPERTSTLLVEGDSHSLAQEKDKNVRRRYLNGIGRHIVVIPKSSGVIHDYLPTHSIALAYLRNLLHRPAQASAGFQSPAASIAEY